MSKLLESKSEEIFADLTEQDIHGLRDAIIENFKAVRQDWKYILQAKSEEIASLGSQPLDVCEMVCDILDHTDKNAIEAALLSTVLVNAERSQPTTVEEYVDIVYRSIKTAIVDEEKVKGRKIVIRLMSSKIAEAVSRFLAQRFTDQNQDLSFEDTLTREARAAFGGEYGEVSDAAYFDAWTEQRLDMLA